MLANAQVQFRLVRECYTPATLAKLFLTDSFNLMARNIKDKHELSLSRCAVVFITTSLR